MAYLTQDVISAGGGVWYGTETTAQLSIFERDTVTVSLADGFWTASGMGLLGRIGNWIYGREPESRLANERLEALRRYAIMYRLRGHAMDQDVRQSVDAAGFTVGQLAEVHRLVDRLTPPAPSWRRRVAKFAAASFLAAVIGHGLYRWLVEHLGDGTISMAVLLLLAGALLPLAPRTMPDTSASR